MINESVTIIKKESDDFIYITNVNEYEINNSLVVTKLRDGKFAINNNDDSQFYLNNIFAFAKYLLLKEKDINFAIYGITNVEVQVIFESIKNLKNNQSMFECKHLDQPLIHLCTENDHDYHKSRVEERCFCLACGDPLVYLPKHFDKELLINYNLEYNDEIKNMNGLERMKYLRNLYIEIVCNADEKDDITSIIKDRCENKNLQKVRKINW